MVGGLSKELRDSQLLSTHIHVCNMSNGFCGPLQLGFWTVVALKYCAMSGSLMQVLFLVDRRGTFLRLYFQYPYRLRSPPDLWFC